MCLALIVGWLAEKQLQYTRDTFKAVFVTPQKPVRNLLIALGINIHLPANGEG
jgi:hypothetical protein